jgi:hypothetical protein
LLFFIGPVGLHALPNRNISDFVKRMLPAALTGGSGFLKPSLRILRGIGVFRFQPFAFLFQKRINLFPSAIPFGKGVAQNRQAKYKITDH